MHFDGLPHHFNCAVRFSHVIWHSFWARLAARWWHVELGYNCAFSGRPRFRRHPGSRIAISTNCKFNSSPASNLIGVNRPCILSTLRESAEIRIGTGCGFSGTVIGCAKQIIIGNNVRCGANTLITDTDWHSNDPRTGPDEPIIIENNVWLGVNVTVLKGVTIGEGTIVGAGSIVTRTLPPGVSAAGIPAKVLKRLDGAETRS